MEEIEVKFLDVDKGALEEQLVAIGAKKVGDFLYRRKVFTQIYALAGIRDKDYSKITFDEVVKKEV